MIDVGSIHLVVVEVERRVLDYFERGKFDGSTVGREWNDEKDWKEILHNKHWLKEYIRNGVEEMNNKCE